MNRANALSGQPILKTIAAVMCLVLLNITLSAQGWGVTFGGDNEDIGVLSLQTIDEGYITIGYSESFGLDNDFDIYAVRTDVDGTVIWSNVYDEGYREEPVDALLLNDGGVLVLGHINEVNGTAPGTPYQLYLLRLNSRGNLVWSRRFANNGLSQRARSFQLTADGGLIITGTTERFSGGDTDVLLLKLNDELEEEWRETYGTSRSDIGVGAIETATGYLMAANIKGSQGIDNDVAFYRLSSTGSLLGLNTYGTENDNEEINKFVPTSDGNAVAVGSASNFGLAYIIKCNLNGDTLWTRQLDASPFDDNLKDVVELHDGSLVAVGLTSPTTSSIDILMAKWTVDGTLQWEKNLGDAFDYYEFGESIQTTIDGGFIISGYSARGSVVFINDMMLVKVDADGNYFTNMIRGKVFWSQDGCNPYTPEDQPLANWLVSVEGENGRFISTTDAEGNYAIPVNPGSYTVSLLTRNDAWDVCSPSSFPVDFTVGYDTLVYNFPVRSLQEQGCPITTVNLSTGVLVACENAVYTVTYANQGSATAEDAYIEILLDEELAYIASTVEPAMIAGNLLTFNIGDLTPLSAGSFQFTVAVDCAAQNLQAAVVAAQVYPAVYCTAPGPEWDGSSIRLKGRCEDGQVIFSARNTGTQPTSGTQNFVIVEDILMLESGQIPVLDPDQEIDLNPIVVNEMGSTYRLIAMQTVGHPGENYPTVAIEGCTTGDAYTTGNFTQFPENDQDPYLDTDVQEILQSTGTANLLIGHPKGYLDSLITNTTDLEYTILFANPGADTLSRLVIRDTLPLELNLNSLSVGPASHPYTFELYDNGLLKITFDGLSLLPAGSTDASASRGYVKFTLSQQPNLPLGTVIDHRAAVYFDYLTPDVTNNVRHVISCDDFLVNLGETGCLMVGIADEPVVSGVKVSILPNPIGTSAEFVVEGCDTCNDMELTLRDSQGRLVRTQAISGPRFTFHRNNLPPALYFFELKTDGKLLQHGKLLIQ